MTAPARPLVVIAGKINPAGVAQLESEARVVITPNQETKTVIEAGPGGRRASSSARVRAATT